ncbi:MAG: DUF2854 domain-containing protein [Oscillatoriales cyanobacterium C42_A2020_001]|nr:DUF2854 domain-containing protein [Leptolyngbyaceae cyanobacterium C42_A2020_001]
MLRQISLAKLGLVAGGILTIIGFIAYFLDNATLNLVGFFYGIPVLLGGLALKAAELEPVPLVQPTPPSVVALRDRQATAIQKQILNDVTRYRYGQRAHLDSSLEALGLAPTDEERPVITGVREGETDGAYTLVLEFDSPMMSLDVWQKKQEKLATFFGPGIRVTLDQPQEERVNLGLVATPEANS